MTNFEVADLIERRNDNPDILTYKVYLDDNEYVISYDKDKLKEVYFVRNFENYFMSCTSDMKTISHYYIHKEDPENKFMNRYENGKLNRVYKVITNRYITCVVDGFERIYITEEEIPEIQPEKCYNDLKDFLDKFNKLKLYEQFSPNELI